MILLKEDGTRVFVRVTSHTAGLRVRAVQFTEADIAELLDRTPEDVVEVLRALQTRFTPMEAKLQLSAQREAVERWNRQLKGSEAIEDHYPPAFTQPPEQLG